VNDNFCKITQYSKEEIIGKDYGIVNSHYHSPQVYEGLMVYNCRREDMERRVKNRTKNGSTYWVDCTIVPFVDDYGEPYQYVSINRHNCEEGYGRLIKRNGNYCKGRRLGNQLIEYDG
jgi:PAS domain S-box-containing protein